MPPEPPSYLVLMPFQPPAKLFFEHVKMGQEAKRILKIRNPSDNSIQVSQLFKTHTIHAYLPSYFFMDR